MNIVVINGSPRKGGNTEIMVDTFIDAAQQNGNTVTKINLSTTKVNPCVDCEYCLTHDGNCVQKNGITEIFKAMDQTELIVFASPVYYFGLTAQIAAVIDRFYAKIHVGHHPTSCALLLNSGSPDVYTGAIAQYRDTAAFLGWEDKGIVTIGGMHEKGSMSSAAGLNKVRELALSLH